MSQNKAIVHQQSLMRQLKQVQENGLLDSSSNMAAGESGDSSLLKALEGKLDPEDFKVL